MSEKMTDVVVATNQEILVKLANTFPPEEEKAILRDLFIVTQIKKITTKETYTDESGYEKTKNVKRNMNPFEGLAYVMICRELKLNPALNDVTMLEDSFYIGLEAHRKIAQSTGNCYGIDAEKVSETEIVYDKKTYSKGSKVPTITKENGKRYEYRCVVKKKMEDGSIVEYVGKGIADPSNVTWGDKATELKIEQMAEARATRRALSKAFPPGMSHVEDVTESPDYEEAKVSETQSLAAPSDKFKRPEVIKAPAPEPKKAPDPEPATEDVDNDQAMEDEQDGKTSEPESVKEPAKPKRSTAKNLREANDEIAKGITEDPQFQEVFGAPKAAATPEAEAPGKDQLARIAELQKELGQEFDTPETRIGAASVIRNLTGLVEEKRKAEAAQTAKAPEPVTPEEAAGVFGEEDAEDPKAAFLEYYAECDEAQIREAGADAKARFMEAMKMKRENPTQQNVEALEEVTAELAAIKQIFMERKYEVK